MKLRMSKPKVGAIKRNDYGDSLRAFWHTVIMIHVVCPAPARNSNVTFEVCLCIAQWDGPSKFLILL